ncbi:hypothetical protein FSP39_013285 [Pinctada imbricata]|uniref:BZIP domain-containing protein n=1 Tax=Pinctada imbricata TaxID=66713 RepID=A0AA88Y435_PINIB|nr:hypothetical protein FSP39_013285 [Pinctada imbricata]
MLTGTKSNYMILPKFSEMEKNITNIPTTIDGIFTIGCDETRNQEVPDMDVSTLKQNEKILEATKMALETGELTPLVKEELKYTIQTRRLAEGKEELQVQFENPINSELRPDEVEKVVRRREQNRQAAQRFRQRQKSRGDELQKKNQKLLSENLRLRREIQTLQTERDRLNHALNEHMAVCPYKNGDQQFFIK